MNRPDLPSVFAKCKREKIIVSNRLRDEQTPAEQLLWDKLRANRLGDLHFRRQHVLLGFIVDFYCRPLGLVIEVDGSVHDTQKEYDGERETVLGQNGLTVIRFSNDRVLNEIDGVLAEILAVATRISIEQSQNDQ